MPRAIVLSAVYPHPPEKVWRALTTRAALERWLMPNDFEPRVGHRFQFRTTPAPGFDGIVHCEVVTLDPPRTLAFTWKGGGIDTVVTFTLRPEGEGTALEFEQAGFEGARGLFVRSLLGNGWKGMLLRKLPAEIERWRD